ncbi:MAG: hypothetical protein RIE53_03955 [Rhodothermales bacterium]
MSESTTQAFALPAHGILQEPELLFHPERSGDTDIHPLRGLLRFGPYSRALINSVIDPIRVGLVVPHDTRGVISHLLKELESTQQPQERQKYLPPFPGFANVFGVRVVPAASSTWIQLPEDLDSRIADAEKPHLVLAEEITKAVKAIWNSGRQECDVLLIYLPDRWESGFYGPKGDDFDLHDHVKAVAAQLNVPTQIIQEESALTYRCRASVMWRLGIALYCKAGGVPWKLAGSAPETAFIGLSYSVRPRNSEGARFITCCSQVFDSDGAGLEFLTYDTNETGVHIERRNPYLSRNEMMRVMARSLSLYQLRHGGRCPKRIVVHKTTEFKPEEIKGCFDAFRSAGEVDLIQVVKSASWKGVLIEEPTKGNKGHAASFPCRRGSFVTLSGRDALLWTQGNVPEAARGRDFYKEGKGIPRPLMLRRYAGHGSWDETCRATLGLTKMNWNNDGLYDRLPVTLAYSDALADVLKRFPSISNGTYQFRYFM